MDWMKSLVSPRARRKNLNLDTENSRVLTASHRIFGVPLDKLVTKTLENDTVPLVVKRICEHIYKFGLDNMDLLRTSDNSRSIENMRLQFDLMGDVNLDAEVHISTTIGLLRIFLLQLPDTLIPRRLTENLFSVIQDTALNKTAIVCGIKTVLNLLPEENYSVLKYISSLLTVVAERRTDNNKMSASSLATLFGPSILRCDLTSDTEELRDIDYSKDIMCWLILEYNALFFTGRHSV
uniref:Rho-GAP domain-containing protein n=1 Tax=Arion vulgaris TaxID=1028688 RepID=A0A0B6ZR09_9EUPU